MPQDRAVATRERLLRTASELIRRKGFTATRIDDVCEAAGLTKGAFFHHFKTKEELAEACLEEWARSGAERLRNAPFGQQPDPCQRVLGCMDFFIEMFDRPDLQKSCLVGTTVQEVSETHPQLRAAAGHCFTVMRTLFQKLLDEACNTGEATVDTASLANLWIATLQGSLILYKACQDPAVIRTNLQHVKQYISGYLPLHKEKDHVARTVPVG